MQQTTTHSRTMALLAATALVLSASCAAGTVNEATSSQAGGSAPESATVGVMTPAPALDSPTAATSSKFFVGVLPDYDNGNTGGLGGWISRTGITPSASSGYVNLGPNGAVQTATGIGYIDEAKKNGVHIISLSLSAIGTGSLNAGQLAGLQAFVDEAQSQQIELWFRFGYEMNYGGGIEQFQRINNNNNPSDFLHQWAQVAAIANPKRNAAFPVKMYWTPNIKSGGTLPYENWFPTDPNTIDVIGVDWYHTPGDEISTKAIVSTLSDIYALSARYKLPFILGETAVSTTQTTQAATDEKAQWLSALMASDLRAQMPLYQGFFWFDYLKGSIKYAVSQDSAGVAAFKAFWQRAFGTTGS